MVNAYPVTTLTDLFIKHAQHILLKHGFPVMRLTATSYAKTSLTITTTTLTIVPSMQPASRQPALRNDDKSHF